MSVNYKIKEVFRKTGFTLMAYAAAKGVAFQGLSRKINHGKWTVDQLFELTQITGCEFRCCFVFKDGTRLYLHDDEKEGEMIMPLDYNELLYEKVQQEYDAFIAGLKLMSNEQVLDSAYEKVIKSDILIECENGRLDQKEAKALYLEKYPLDRIYQDWLKSDFSYMDMIRDTIDDSAKDAIKERREKHRESR